MNKITKKSTNTIVEIFKSKLFDIEYNVTNPDNEEIVLTAHVKPMLSIEEKGKFVDRVVNNCFDASGDFLPQNLDPVFMITLLQMTTDIPVFETYIPIVDENGEETGEKTPIVNVGKTYDLCMAVNLPKNIKDSRYQALIAELRDMVKDKLEYYKKIQIRRITSVVSALQPLLSVSENSDTVNALTNNISQLANSMKNVINIQDIGMS